MGREGSIRIPIRKENYFLHSTASKIHSNTLGGTADHLSASSNTQKSLEIEWGM
jgi:hypothetical protein